MTFAARTMGYSTPVVLLYDGTITQGYNLVSDGFTSNAYYGFAVAALSGGTAIGSRSPTTLITDSGKTLVGAYDEVYTVPGPTATYYGRVAISGFSSDPGWEYISYAVRGGVTTHVATSGGYVWNSGTGTANWYTTLVMDSSALYGFSTSGTTSFQIYR